MNTVGIETDEDRYVREFVDTAPPLSRDQRAKLALILNPQPIQRQPWVDQRAAAA